MRTRRHDKGQNSVKEGLVFCAEDYVHGKSASAKDEGMTGRLDDSTTGRWGI